MKLYYAPGACSLAPHIALEEAGLQYDAVPVDLSTKIVAGKSYLKINPKGAVPALELDSGELLTENAVILQYIAELKPGAHLMPNGNSKMERYRTLEWLNFIATEIHKGFTPLWNPTAPEETKRLAKATLDKKFDYINTHLEKSDFLMGKQFTLPDIYLTVMLGWAKHHKIDLTQMPALMGFEERVKMRPAVQKTLKAEGLLH